MRRVGRVAMDMRKAVVFALVSLFAAPALSDPAARSRNLINLLQTRRISVEFEKASLQQFVKFVRLSTGINIVVRKARIEKDGGDVDSIEISLKVRDVRVLHVLRLALETQGLGLATKGNILIITSKKDARGKPVLVMYNVADLLIGLRDFPGGDMNVYGSNMEVPEPPEPEIHHSIESSDELAEMVRQFTGRDTWEDEGINIHVFRKHLFIRTYPAVHQQIRRFLNAVRGMG